MCISSGSKGSIGAKEPLLCQKGVFRGGQNKNTHPLKNQGWDTKVFHGSTLVVVYIKLPLIDALTGAPGRAFLPCGSEVVSSPAGVRMPHTKRHPLWESYRGRVSSSQPFIQVNLSYFPSIVKYRSYIQIHILYLYTKTTFFPFLHLTKPIMYGIMD